MNASGSSLIVRTDPHAAAAAAERGFQHDRHAELLRERAAPPRPSRWSVRSRNQGEAALLRQPLGDHLVAHLHDGLRPGPDPREASTTRFAKAAFSGQEPVPGVDGLDAVRLGDVDDALEAEVRAHGGLARVHAVGLVGFVPVRREAVRPAEDGDGVHAQLGARAEDAHRDLAAVRAQDLRQASAVAAEDLAQTALRVHVLGIRGGSGDGARDDRRARREARGAAERRNATLGGGRAGGDMDPSARATPRRASSARRARAASGAGRAARGRGRDEGGGGGGHRRGREGGEPNAVTYYVAVSGERITRRGPGGRGRWFGATGGATRARGGSEATAACGRARTSARVERGAGAGTAVRRPEGGECPSQ